MILPFAEREYQHDSVAEDCKFAAPKMSDYEKCNSREDILKMKSPRGGFKGKYDGASGVLLAPFAVEALVKEESQDHHALILAVTRAAKDHDHSDAGLESDHDAALDHAEIVANLLWGAANGKVQETKMLYR